VVAPEPPAGDHRPRQVGGVSVGELPGRVVDGADLEPVQVVVAVQGGVPAVELGLVGVAGDLLQTLASGRQSLGQVPGQVRRRLRVG
jgi:hypothetical protein